MSAMEQARFALPSPSRIFTPAVTFIMILSAAGFLLVLFARDFAINFFALVPQSFIHGRLWQILTYPFVTTPCGLVFSGLIILFIGSSIEREWKTGSFVLLWLIVSIVCGLIWVLVNLLIGKNIAGMGAAACSYGFIATMGLLYRGRRLFIFFATIEAQYLALILIAVSIIINITNPMNLVWILGAPVAYLYIKMRWKMASRGRIDTAGRGRRRSGSFVDID
jgi:membrane associated rhomboid family serine protease